MIKLVPDGTLEQFGVVVVLEEFLEVFEKLPDDAVRLYSSSNHMGNFFDCVSSRELPICAGIINGNYRIQGVREPFPEAGCFRHRLRAPI